MAKKIKDYSISGVIRDDSDIPRLRASWENLIISNHRECGYIPILDLDAVFVLEYDHEEEKYSFELTLYFVYVGKKKAKIWEGLSQNKLVPRVESCPPNM